MAQIEEKPFDVQHFFETRQLIAGELGDIHSQRRITDIRQKIAEQRMEEIRQAEVAEAEKAKTTKKTTNKKETN